MLSFWEKESYYADADIAIAGAGLLGLWTAYELLQRKPTLRVVLIESRTLPALAATRNAGFACFGSPTELLADAAAMGEDAMLQVVESRIRGIERIRQAFGDKAIQYDPSGGYECIKSGQFENVDEIQHHLNRLNKGFERITGLHAVYKIADEKLKQYGLTGFDHLLENRVEGGLHSGWLVRSLMQAILGKGALLLNAHTCKKVEETEGGFIVTMKSADPELLTIKAKRVLMVTNAALSKQFPDMKIVPARGQVMISPPIASLSLAGTFHYDEGFYYFRNVGNRMLLGGGRNTSFKSEKTMALKTNPDITLVLESFVKNHMPQVAPYLGAKGWMHWSGIMALSESKQPVWQEIAPGYLAAMACNGMGVALTPVMADQLAQQLLHPFL